MANAIKYLYSQFILRDVLSFITPGAIVVLTAFLLLLPEPCLSQRLDKLFEYSRYIHWLLYIPLFGIFYMVGFAIQCFGEFIGFIRIHRIARSCWCQRFKVFGCNWACKRHKKDKNRCYEPDFIWWKEAHKAVVEFYERTSDKDWARQQDERLVVLKQMCGNGFLAIAIAAFLLGISFIPWLWLKLPLRIILVLLPLVASLFWGYRVHVLRQDTMSRAIRHQL